jgi:hypothetical protein
VLKEGFPRIHEERFLRSAMYRYTNEDVVAMLGRQNVSIHARDNGRVFPDSGRAEDVLAAFERELRLAEVIVHTRSRIDAIESRSDGVWSLLSNGERFQAGAVILATGGTSYSKTGTTGDGIRYAEQLGHTIVPIRAALAPIYLAIVPSQEIVGIALKHIELVVTRENKTVASECGDILITHRGLSGPAVLGISNRAAMEMESGSITMEANLLDLREEDLRERLIQAQQSRGQQQISTWLDEMLPNRFVPFVLVQAEIPNNRRWNALAREERNRLAKALLRYSFGEVSEIPLERGEVTSGGVDLSEVDAKTMMSRLRHGLFFAGEMLDVAGEIGGYNLQAAYSTGWIAGETAVKFLGGFDA